jgi:hypothetical protein
MPIRINLLAEAQAAEEARRKDPVKRAILAGALIVAVIGVWSSMVQVKIITRRSEYNSMQAGWKSIDEAYKAAVETRHQAMETQEKLVALQQLTTNRFLWGTTLNALQQTLNGIDDVQVTRVRADQTYALTEEVKAKTGEHPVAAKPAAAVEKVVMTIEGIDYSAQPGARLNRFKAGIAGEPYFQTALNKTNGVTLLTFANVQNGVKFSLQCLFPEKVRQ